jgi:hypothetical protein
MKKLSKKTSLYIEILIGSAIVLSIAIFLAYLKEWIGFVVFLSCGLLPTIALFLFTTIILDNEGIRKFGSKNSMMKYADIGSILITDAPMVKKQISITSKADCLLQAELEATNNFKLLSKIVPLEFSYSDKCLKYLLDNLGITYNELFGDLTPLLDSEKTINDYRIDIIMAFGKPCIRIIHNDVL